MGLAGGLATNGEIISGGGGSVGTVMMDSGSAPTVDHATALVDQSGWYYDQASGKVKGAALLQPPASSVNGDLWYYNGSALVRLAIGSSGQVLQPSGGVPAWAALATPTLTATTQSGTAYTLALADQNTVVETTSASAVSVTVPPNSSVAFPVGTVIEIVQFGAGQVTLVAGAGVTLRNPSSLTSRAQYSTIGLRKRATDEWVVSGDLT